jgi:hypothetical protein
LVRGVTAASGRVARSTAAQGFASRQSEVASPAESEPGRDLNTLSYPTAPQSPSARKSEFSGLPNRQHPHRDEEKPGYVYLIRRSDGMIKVGVSRNVAKRRSRLAQASPETLSILKTIKPGRALAFHVEGGVKVLLRQFRARGEWFKCSDTLALLALRAAEHGELECRSCVATEIKRQKLRTLDAHSHCQRVNRTSFSSTRSFAASAFGCATVVLTAGCFDPGSSSTAPMAARGG